MEKEKNPNRVEAGKNNWSPAKSEKMKKGQSKFWSKKQPSSDSILLDFDFDDCD